MHQVCNHVHWSYFLFVLCVGNFAEKTCASCAVWTCWNGARNFLYAAAFYKRVHSLRLRVSHFICCNCCAHFVVRKKSFSEMEDRCCVCGRARWFVCIQLCAHKS